LVEKEVVEYFAFEVVVRAVEYFSIEKIGYSAIVDFAIVGAVANFVIEKVVIGKAGYFACEYSAVECFGFGGFACEYSASGDFVIEKVVIGKAEEAAFEVIGFELGVNVMGVTEGRIAEVARVVRVASGVIAIAKIEGGKARFATADSGELAS
jgi:hypothetical protein